MIISEILKIIDCVSYRASEAMLGRDILTICHNSRHASPACLFFCKVGPTADGHDYARHAYDNGARYFVAQRELDIPGDAAVFIVKDAAKELNKLAVAFYGNPAKDLKLIGITGTKGKTTVALSIFSIASELGIKIGYIGTNGIYYNGKRLETANTTPDCPELQRNLREMVKCGITTVVIEVSSQALWQDRVYGLKFDACIFTNLFEDHIGGFEHPTLEHYRECKKLLLTKYCDRTIIINSDSFAADYMLDGVYGKVFYKVSAQGDESCDIYAMSCAKSKLGVRPGMSFELFSGIDSKISINEHGMNAFVPLPGLYSIENALLTVAACTFLGLDIDKVIQCLASLQITGRFERVELNSKKKSLFVIDYAHNGASLTAVLNALREYEPGRIICLFGSVGGRTFGRRAELGKAARAGADIVIVTSDNPDNEEPMKVINEIAAELDGWDKPYYLIADRKSAIVKAYELAEDGDFVLLAGKGHETYQLIGGERLPFSEREILERIDALNTVYN